MGVVLACTGEAVSGKEVRLLFRARLKALNRPLQHDRERRSGWLCRLGTTATVAPLPFSSLSL
jgi:hypothetical protein